MTKLRSPARGPFPGSVLGCILALSVSVSGGIASAHADVSESARTPAAAPQPEMSASEYLADSRKLFASGQYFKAARYAFAAQERDPGLEREAYAWIALGLARSGLENAASYFFIRTLQRGDRASIRRVLALTEELQTRLGGDLVRRYLIRHTQYDDYDAMSRSAFLYSLGKEHLLKGQEEKAIGYLNGMSSQSSLWPYALQMRATAHAIQGKAEQAIADFQACAERARDLAGGTASDSAHSSGNGTALTAARKMRQAEADDLRNRCIAGEARALYQMGRFDEADWVYDQIPKQSFVWTEILFEQAWNSFARQQYNRALGKLVSYKSPDLKFVFNSEVDVLRAQSYLGLCLYSDANEVINEFNSRYAKVGEELKRFIESKSESLYSFHEFGKKALKAPLHTPNDPYRLANRFVRSPYFQGLVAADLALESEIRAIGKFDSMQPGVSHQAGRGFPGFLTKVLSWRRKSVRQLGGAFVKNSLIDYHSNLVADFEKMAFIKLEMLSRAKDKLLKRASSVADRSRGDIEPSRRDDQYRWSFNGEFWNDELGDYVFGLESECAN